MTRTGGWRGLLRALGAGLWQPLRRSLPRWWPGSGVLERSSGTPAAPGDRERTAPDPVRTEMRRLQAVVDGFARDNMTVVYILRCGDKERWRIAPGVTELLAPEPGVSNGISTETVTAYFGSRSLEEPADRPAEPATEETGPAGHPARPGDDRDAAAGPSPAAWGDLRRRRPGWVAPWPSGATGRVVP